MSEQKYNQLQYCHKELLDAREGLMIAEKINERLEYKIDSQNKQIDNIWCAVKDWKIKEVGATQSLHEIMDILEWSW